MREWLQFSVLGLIWGSAFLWIKIALDEMTPFTLVALRMCLATTGLLVVMRIRGLRFPRDPKILKHLGVMAVLSPCLPLLLVSWAETRIDSTVASVLNGTVPLFTIILAHGFLSDERMTPAAFGGLVVGFLGVLVLMGQDLSVQALVAGNLGGQIALILATLLYAASTIYSRRYIQGLSPIVHSAGLMAYSAVMTVVIALIFEAPLHLPHAVVTWVAVFWLGILSSCFGFIMFFDLLRKWGATRSSVVNYVFPVIGVALGIIVRGEPLGWRLVAGAALILSGIALVNLKAIRGRSY